MASYGPELIQTMRTVLDEVMTKIPVQQVTPGLKAHMAEVILKAAAEGQTSYDALLASASNQIQTVLSTGAAPAYAASSAATSQSSAKAKKHQRIARTQTRRRNDKDDNHDQRASYWSGRGSIDAQHRRGYRAWAHGGPRSSGWF